MGPITLTDFVDFSIVNGSSRIAKVRAIKKRGPYDPAADFWKGLREGLVGLHKAGVVDKKSLDAIVAAASPRRQPRYAEAIVGYKKFLAKKPSGWFAPGSATWTEGALEVRVNPELGLVIDEQRTSTKLYFKNESPTRARVQAVLALMEIALPSAKRRYAVLDVSSGSLILPDGRWTKGDMAAVLRSDARAFESLWNDLV